MRVCVAGRRGIGDEFGMKLIASLALAVLLATPVFAQSQPLESILDRADAIAPLEAVVVAIDGTIVAERGFDGHGLDTPTNIKSASKTVISALVGIAIDKGLLAGTEQAIAPILAGDIPDDADPRIAAITVGNLLSMQAGLGPTSGPRYGAWVKSRNWVRAALSEPFEADPGGPMLYSTGSSHLLSAILTKVAKQSTLASANDWLDAVEGFQIGGWSRDPQGIYIGGNEMAMSPHSFLAFGEVYRTGGLAADGTRILPSDWIDQSWTPRTHSIHTGDGYGYGWFFRTIGNEEVKFAWGFGGQMLYIVPSLGLTVAMTSDETLASAETGHLSKLHRLLAEIIAVVRAGAPPVATAEVD
jgi:CubicO group peptidase (beta-lactamase class C family)